MWADLAEASRTATPRRSTTSGRHRPTPASTRTADDRRAPGIDGLRRTRASTVGPTTYGPGSPAPGRRCCCSTASRRRTTAGTASRRALAERADGRRVRPQGLRREPRPAPGGELRRGLDQARDGGRAARADGARSGSIASPSSGTTAAARVAYRMALDHPDAVERLCVLNIVPTVDQFERMAAEAALDYFPWYLLAQPRTVRRARRDRRERRGGRPSPARRRGSPTPGAITPEATERYVAAFTRRGDRGHLRRVPGGVPPRPPDGRRRPRGRAADRAVRCSCIGATRRGRCPTGRCASGGGGPRTSRAARCRRGTSFPRRPRRRWARRFAGSSPPPADRRPPPGRPRALRPAGSSSPSTSVCRLRTKTVPWV